MAKALIVGNWKAYVTSLQNARKLFGDIDKGLPRGMKADVVICPPAPFLYPLSVSYKGTRIAFGAQDAAAEDGLPAQAGKQTGAVTASMLKDAGASYAIVGHSERRAAGDTDDAVARKLVAVLAAGLTPIVCIGEKERDKEGHYLAALEQQLNASLARIEPGSLKKIIIAYEPVWAVGATTLPTAREIREAIIFIRKILASRFDRAAALKVRILYGGDVNGTNVIDLVADSDTSGFLIGRASVDAREFCAIIKASS